MLSVGGRLILIKHVLAAIPLYTFTVLEPPKSILCQLEKIMSSFFWGEVDERDKRHWTKWSNLCKPTQENGLGLCQLDDTAKAFECKLWRKLGSSNTLWSQFMLSKYASVEHITTAAVKPSSSYNWKRMLRVRDLVENNLQILIRDGSASFWHDSWLGSGPLRGQKGKVPLLHIRGL